MGADQAVAQNTSSCTCSKDSCKISLHRNASQISLKTLVGTATFSAPNALQLPNTSPMAMTAINWFVILAWPNCLVPTRRVTKFHRLHYQLTVNQRKQLLQDMPGQVRRLQAARSVPPAAQLLYEGNEEKHRDCT
mmetsp:Transcript_81704/g.144537  ORF Transcript_81704/g.144537 Transcript_81704/m.144537 type:complete len:135 (-) Transcript_81704:2-406(-)